MIRFEISNFLFSYKNNFSFKSIFWKLIISLTLMSMYRVWPAPTPSWYYGDPENFEVVYFLWDELFWSFRVGLLFREACISQRGLGPGIFWPVINTFYFLVFIFHKDLIKVLYFPQKSLWYFFSDPCFCATVQKFRLLDQIIMLNATILGMTLKSMVSVCSP